MAKTLVQKIKGIDSWIVGEAGKLGEIERVLVRAKCEQPNITSPIENILSFIQPTNRIEPIGKQLDRFVTKYNFFHQVPKEPSKVSLYLDQQDALIFSSFAALIKHKFPMDVISLILKFLWGEEWENVMERKLNPDKLQMQLHTFFKIKNNSQSHPENSERSPSCGTH